MLKKVVKENQRPSYAPGIIPFLLRQEWLQLKDGMPKVSAGTAGPRGLWGQVASLVNNVKTFLLRAKPKEVPAKFD